MEKLSLRRIGLNEIEKFKEKKNAIAGVLTGGVASDEGWEGSDLDFYIFFRSLRSRLNNVLYEGFLYPTGTCFAHAHFTSMKIFHLLTYPMVLDLSHTPEHFRDFDIVFDHTGKLEERLEQLKIAYDSERALRRRIMMFASKALWRFEDARKSFSFSHLYRSLIQCREVVDNCTKIFFMVKERSLRSPRRQPEHFKRCFRSSGLDYSYGDWLRVMGLDVTKNHVEKCLKKYVPKIRRLLEVVLKEQGLGNVEIIRPKLTFRANTSGGQIPIEKQLEFLEPGLETGFYKGTMYFLRNNYLDPIPSQLAKIVRVSKRIFVDENRLDYFLKLCLINEDFINLFNKCEGLVPTVENTKEILDITETILMSTIDNFCPIRISPMYHLIWNSNGDQGSSFFVENISSKAQDLVIHRYAGRFVETDERLISSGSKSELDNNTFKVEITVANKACFSIDRYVKACEQKVQGLLITDSVFSYQIIQQLSKQHLRLDWISNLDITRSTNLDRYRVFLIYFTKPPFSFQGGFVSIIEKIRNGGKLIFLLDDIDVFRIFTCNESNVKTFLRSLNLEGPLEIHFDLNSKQFFDPNMAMKSGMYRVGKGSVQFIYFNGVGRFSRKANPSLSDLIYEQISGGT